MATNRDLVDGAAGTRAFVLKSATFITLPAPVIPFQYSSLCSRLLSTASGWRPCALCVVTPQRVFCRCKCADTNGSFREKH